MSFVGQMKSVSISPYRTDYLCYALPSRSLQTRCFTNVEAGREFSLRCRRYTVAHQQHQKCSSYFKMAATVCSLPVPAIMFKRLVQDASREEAPVTAIVFTLPVQDSGPSCSHSPSMPQPPTNHVGRFMGSTYFPYPWWSMGTHRKWTAFRS